MGFRDEALPSIASVSEVTLSTKVHGALNGTKVKVKGGRMDLSASWTHLKGI